MVRIKRISIGSAFKVAAVFSALMWLITAGLLFVFPSLFFFNFSTSTSSSFSTSSSGDFAEFTGLSLILIFLCGVPMYAIIGGLMGAFSAFIYNLVSGWIGGLEVELERGVQSSVSWRSVDVPNNPGAGDSGYSSPYGNPFDDDEKRKNDPFDT